MQWVKKKFIWFFFSTFVYGCAFFNFISAKARLHCYCCNWLLVSVRACACACTCVRACVRMCLCVRMYFVCNSKTSNWLCVLCTNFSCNFGHLDNSDEKKNKSTPLIITQCFSFSSIEFPYLACVRVCSIILFIFCLILYFTFQGNLCHLFIYLFFMLSSVSRWHMK